ncbi:MAG: ABC transporter permease [Intrasporangiaceae bacterium]|nr:ABC transporter permease [Intrasporangiaceae bacterium]
MRRLLTLTLSDLRQRIRDRSVILFALVVPLALMGVFNLVFGTAQELELKPITVAVAQVLAGVDEDSAGFAVTVLDLPAGDVASAIGDGRAELGVVVPEGFAAAVQSGQGAVVDVTEGASTLESAVVVSVLDGLLTRLQSDAVVAQAAVAGGLPPEQLQEIVREASTGGPAFELVPGEAAVEQLSPPAALVAGQTGLFLLFTVSFGVLGLIEERQNGTLARLRSMPMPTWLVVAAKALVSVVLGLVATTVLLLAGGWMFDVGFGSPVAVAVLVVSVVLAATSVMFLVVRVARTAEQAGVAASIVALVLGIAGGAFMPISASGAAAVLLDLNPVAAFLRGLGITAGGGGVTDLGVPVAIMLGFAVAMVAVSRLVPDRGVTA